MPDHRTMPDIRAIVAKALQRIDSLERRLSSFRVQKEDEVVFSQSGKVRVQGSGPRRLRHSTRLVEVHVLVGTVGTTSTSVGIYRNGSLLDTVVLAANSPAVVLPFSAIFGADSDILTAAILTAGTGARDLTIQCRFG